MNDPESVKGAEPAEGRGLLMPELGWVRIAIAVAAVSCSAVAALGLLSGHESGLEEVGYWILASGAVVALLMFGRKPVMATVVALAVVFADAVCCLWQAHSPHSPYLAVFPVLVVSAGVLLGRRGVWGMGVASALAVPLSLWLNGAFARSEGGFYGSDFASLLVAECAIGVAAALTCASLDSYVKARSELERHRRRYAELFQEAPDGLVALDGSGRICESNEAAARMLRAASTAALAGRVFEEVWKAAGGAHAPDLASARPGSPLSVDLRGDDGQQGRRLELTARVPDEALGGTLLMIRDVTDRRILEERLGHAQRLESIGRLAGGVAHDFNNLLTVIGGNALLLAGHPDPEVREQVREIVDAEKRGSNLSRQLLAFARRDIHRPQVVDLGQVVAGVSRLLDPLLGEQYRLGLRREKGVYVMADIAQLEQVMLNLVANARDAMPMGGVVEISVRLLLGTEAAQLGSTLVDGPQAMLEIADTGVGMTPEVRQRIFEPFFTTKPRGEGTGLGLASVHGVVAQSGGSIHVDTAPGKGTRFRIFFRQVDGAPEEEPVVRGLQIPDDGGRHHVLLVEDEDHVRALGVRILTRAGFRVTDASSAEEALEALRKNTDVDVLVTDVVMPGPSGVDLVSMLRPERPDLPVLFVSGHFEDRFAHANEIDPARNLLTKPFSPDSLVQKLHELLDD